ncbi:MAG: HEPN domain-containing protein [Chloroflexi bacterium]|nr:HEPN domain-containing protein [Chloroflexota bacterium]
MSAFKPPEEWFKQAEYDLKTAEAMLKARRYINAVFMCHLAIEKALKGLYAKKFQKDPPKIHNLNYFAEAIGIELSEDLRDFMDNLNTVSVPARYPDELKRLLKEYTPEPTKNVLKRTKELLRCLKEKVKHQDWQRS